MDPVVQHVSVFRAGPEALLPQRRGGLRFHEPVQAQGRLCSGKPEAEPSLPAQIGAPRGPIAAGSRSQ